MQSCWLALGLYREERPHLPSGHPLPHAGEATASSAAICQTKHSSPQATMQSLLPLAGEGGAKRRMRGAFRLHREERPHLPSGHPLPHAGEATASSAAMCQTKHSSPQATMQSLLPPAGEGGAKRRMRGAFCIHRKERPHLPSGHPLPQAGEVKAGGTAICHATRKAKIAAPPYIRKPHDELP